MGCVCVCMHAHMRERERINQICISRHHSAFSFQIFFSIHLGQKDMYRRLVKCVIDQVQKDGGSGRNAKGWEGIDRFIPGILQARTPEWVAISFPNA